MRDSNTTIKGHNYNIKISTNIDQVMDEWPIDVSNPFLSIKYLKCITSAPPANTQFAYVVVKSKEGFWAVYYFQILHFNAAKSLSAQPAVKKGKRSFFVYLKSRIKALVAKNIDFNTLVNGNLLLTGENGFECQPPLEPEVIEELHGHIYRATMNYLKEVQQVETTVLLVKEFYQNNRLKTPEKHCGNLHEFCIEPNFIFEVSPSWLSIDDYKNELRAKYRIRANRAEKKLKPVRTVTLSAKDILANEDRLYQLYKEVADNVGFNMVNINTHYFYQLKRTFKDEFSFIAFVSNEQIVGFYSYFLFKDKLVAHYVGFDPDFTVKNQLYLNMLLQLIQKAIDEKLTRINLGRTANEIKSSIGAKPIDMYCYIKHKKPSLQTMVPGLIDYLQPQQDWEARHPYKKEKL